MFIVAIVFNANEIDPKEQNNYEMFSTRHTPADEMFFSLSLCCYLVLFRNENMEHDRQYALRKVEKENENEDA